VCSSSVSRVRLRRPLHGPGKRAMLLPAACKVNAAG